MFLVIFNGIYTSGFLNGIDTPDGIEMDPVLPVVYEFHTLNGFQWNLYFWLFSNGLDIPDGFQMNFILLVILWPSYP